MSIKLEGFDDAQRKLQELIDRSRAIPKEENISLNQLLTPAFMQEHTQFSTLEGMLEGSGFPMESIEGFQVLSTTDEWNAFIAQHTDCATWQDLIDAAHADRIKRQLGF